MKLFYGFLLLSCLYVKAQPVTVGDKCPPLLLSNLINYPSQTASLSEFYKKPLLLSFWSTTCEVSTEYLLHIDSLKKELGNSVDWLFVSLETEEKLRKALSKERLGNIHFPFSVGDTLLRKFFPLRTVPHVCWIDVNGEVKAITGHEEVTKKNVLDFSKGQLKPQPLKAESMDDDIYFSLTPLMVNDYNRNKGKLIVSSYLGEHRPEVMSYFIIAIYDPQENTVRIRAINSSIFNLYKLAYKELKILHFSQLIQIGSTFYKKDKYFNPRYCYDLIIRDTSTEKAHEFMQKDLDRYFSIKSKKEKRRTKVWVLKSIADLNSIKAKNIKNNELYEKDGLLIANAIRLQGVVEYLNSKSYFEYPIIDETGYNEGVDLIIKINSNKLSIINNELKRYGLVLLAKTREIDVIVIKKSDD